MRYFKDRLVQNLLKTTIRMIGEKIEYRYKRGGRKEIYAVFDEDYEAVDPDTEKVISSNQPTIGINLTDLNGKPAVDDQVVRLEDGQKYRVTDTREDGQGGALLLLHSTLFL